MYVVYVLIKVITNINAPISKVWNVVSDIDNETKFWKGTKKIRNISTDGKNIVTREITIAFRDLKCIQKVNLYPNNRIYFTFIDGIIKGTKTLNLYSTANKTRIEIIWKINVGGWIKLFMVFINSHIKKGTEQALYNTRNEIENG